MRDKRTNRSFLVDSDDESVLDVYISNPDAPDKGFTINKKKNIKKGVYGSFPYKGDESSSDSEESSDDLEAGNRIFIETKERSIVPTYIAYIIFWVGMFVSELVLLVHCRDENPDPFIYALVALVLFDFIVLVPYGLYHSFCATGIYLVHKKYVSYSKFRMGKMSIRTIKRRTMRWLVYPKFFANVGFAFYFLAIDNHEKHGDIESQILLAFVGGFGLLIFPFFEYLTIKK